ncbi:MAG: hypothetical protein U5K69_20395 [Balneolaceae bacterium]|nr:hypothetical protein [Balneolaceae bacterium]
MYHLVFQLSDGLNHSYQSTMVGKEGRRPRYAHLKKLDNAGPLLHDLLEIYWKGLHQKIPLFTETSYKFAKYLLEKEYDPDRALARARNKEWTSSKYNKWAEDADPYINILFKNSEPIDTQEFKNISLKLWKPIISHIEIIETLHE